MVKEKSTSSPRRKTYAPVSHAVGRRKSAVARVWIRKGKGAVTVNGLACDVYFDTAITRTTAIQPLLIVPVGKEIDIDVTVLGGGKVGQAGAVKLGIARALLNIDGAIKPALREHDLLTVDARNKERKKYGRRGARRRFQFVKR